MVGSCVSLPIVLCIIEISYVKLVWKGECEYESPTDREVRWMDLKRSELAGADDGSTKTDSRLTEKLKKGIIFGRQEPVIQMSGK